MALALAADFAAVPNLNVRLTLDDRDPPPAGPWQIEPVGLGVELATLAKLALEVDAVLVIAPETRGILLERTRLLEAIGVWSLGSSSSAVADTGDKLRLAGILGRAGLPTPAALVLHPVEPLPTDADYPAILKPIDGAGSLETFRVESSEACDPRSRTSPQPTLFQRMHQGAPRSASFLVDPIGRTATLIGFADQRFEVVDGQYHYRGGTIPAESPASLVAFHEAIRAVPGLGGWVGVDFLLDEEGGFTILEINPRPTTSFVGWGRLYPPGRLAEAWLACVHGETADCHQLLSGRSEGLDIDFTPDGTILERTRGLEK